MTFNNYGGTCGFQYPAWVRDVENPETRARPAARALQRYREMQAFQNSKERPYIHLVDGGVADNIGVRGVLEALEELAASATFRDEVGFGVIRQDRADRRERPLVTPHRLGPKRVASRRRRAAAAGLGRADRPVLVRNRRADEGSRGDRQVAARAAVARKRLAGATEAQAEASVPKVDLHVLDVSFDAIPDPKERDYFMNLPTSFVLPAEDVDRLREVAGRLLRESAEFEALVREFGGTPAKSSGGGVATELGKQLAETRRRLVTGSKNSGYAAGRPNFA